MATVGGRGLLLVGAVVATMAGWAVYSHGPVFRPKPAVQAHAEHAHAEHAAPPKIVAVQASHDYGKVEQGKTVEHVFKLRNNGGSELIIERAKGS